MSRAAPIAAQAWFTAKELADAGLPGLAGTKQGMLKLAGREGWADQTDDTGTALARPRRARGGGIEYHVALLPAAAQARLSGSSKAKPAERPDRDSAWMRYDRLSASMKAEASLRLETVQRVESLMRAGLGKSAACREVAGQACREARAAGENAPFSVTTLYAWFKRIDGVEASDRLAYLAPDYVGRVAAETVPAALLDLYKADYLRPSKPTHIACYRRAGRVAEERGLAMPSAKTFQRRIEAEIPRDVQVLMRGGVDEAMHAYPHMTRSREGLAPLQIVNLDGHIWDVRVVWPDGTEGRPNCLAVQDIASGKVLAVRFDQTLNHHLVRLALADTFKDFGLPHTVLMDNGKENSAGAIAGGQPTRWRWKTREEDHAGLLKLLDIKALFATPYWGQAKPIERAFRNFADELAKHPAFNGAYVGRNTVEKPSDYGSRAIPIAEFEAIVRREVAILNAQPGRRGIEMAGRSFDAVFAEGIERHGVRRATAEQLRLALLASQPLTLDGRENTIRLVGGMRFWSPELGAMKRQRVIVRFDPEKLSSDIHVYTVDGRYLCDAKMVAQGSFDNVGQARAQRALVRDYRKGLKATAKALVRLEASDVAAALPATDLVGAMQASANPKIIRPAFGAPKSAEKAGKPDFSAGWARSARSGSGGG